jgi:pimeloyl-ACP methyl ester carboxylesterase
VVVMHGKGGAPSKFVPRLAAGLESAGFLVANPEMPWSGRRDYDVPEAQAEQELQSIIDGLRARGAEKIFLAGHSFGGLFSLIYATAHPLAGVIAIAPGANPAAPIFREKVGESVEQARRMIAEGKGSEKTRFLDYEGSKGLYPIVTTPDAYFTWFDPEGAMNQMRALRKLGPDLPVLYIVPVRDYPGLLSVKQVVLDALPKNPKTVLYEPATDHLGAPSASVEKIVGWIDEVLAR